MTSAFASKFRASLWVTPVMSGILAFALITICISLSETAYGTENANQIMLILAILIGLVGYIIYYAITRFIKVAVTPGALVVRYLFNNKKAVEYSHIEHISLVSGKSISRGGGTRSSIGGKIKLKIELDNGEKLYLYEESYENFDELKEAIRRARFNLD